jgi:uncharacterized membrane protein
MHKGRLEAFTDGVIAVIITIMVLEMKAPPGADLAALASTLPVFLIYVLSYINVAIFWNNHHHMLQASKRVDGRALWANLFLLFWLSLVPSVIRWMGDTDFAALPTAAYGFILTMAAIPWLLIRRLITGSASLCPRSLSTRSTCTVIVGSANLANTSGGKPSPPALAARGFGEFG